MNAEITVNFFSDMGALDSLYSPLKLEGRSAPPGGAVEIELDKDRPLLIIRMTSEEVSTSRAMLNSYMGLLSAAHKAASGKC